ncbi:PH domain-containing protein [Anthocerotibacter panamensis]|uniref:PH domain-containing protein n=1 Tax=Anthocerotibacter panamensis TaxID=2857077 RepID=UPI001C406699|nr:PH domain-containing protein [Anthocerotibacter panamensis]
MAIQEEVIFEGRSHVGDLISNTFLLVTIVWLPFFVASLVRYIFTRYRFTNRRITVEGGWLGRKRTDIIYREVSEVRDVPATLAGSFMGYGVLLITLKDGSRLELRAVPRFRELAQYVRERTAQYVDRKAKSATKS